MKMSKCDFVCPFSLVIFFKVSLICVVFFVEHKSHLNSRHVYVGHNHTYHFLHETHRSLSWTFKSHQNQLLHMGVSVEFKQFWMILYHIEYRGMCLISLHLLFCLKVWNFPIYSICHNLDINIWSSHSITRQSGHPLGIDTVQRII